MSTTAPAGPGKEEPACLRSVAEGCRGIDRTRADATRRVTMDPALAQRVGQDRPGKRKRQSQSVRRILCGARKRTVATIPLGRRSRAGSSHLPAASPSRVVSCLFGVAPRRDCPFHPPAFAIGYGGRLVSVALILTLRWAGVTCYAALRSPDVPPAGQSPEARDLPAVARPTLPRSM